MVSEGLEGMPKKVVPELFESVQHCKTLPLDDTILPLRGYQNRSILHV